MRALAIAVGLLTAQPPTDADCLLQDDVECPEFEAFEEPEPEPEMDSMDCWAAGLCDEPDEPATVAVPAPQVTEMEPELPPPPPRPDPAKEERRLKIKVGVLIGVGAAVAVGGIALMAAGAGSAPTTGSGPMCTTGKRCGQTCIALDKQCHVGSGGGDSPGIPPKPGLLISGGVLTAVGVGLVGAGVVIWIRTPPRLTFSPTSITFSF